ncbi:hypothetical protein ABTZ21_12675 [Streptomyces sp. NPDC096191]|uniref:hypothetical protein n=1 Tax=Streptomyces sp. NPDC096191 TaxID=3155426 RepID=UPI00332AC9D9
MHGLLEQARAALALRVPRRELTPWHLLHESRAPVEQALALNSDYLDYPVAAPRSARSDP